MTNQERTELRIKVAQKTAFLQQTILIGGLNMSSSTVAALRFTARLIELGREQQPPTPAVLKTELEFAIADSQRHKEPA